MGIFDKIAGEFIDVIDWTDASDDVIVFRFDRHGNEIKFGAQLTVRESQVAVFINEGQLADVFQPGMYELETQNLPILSTLQGWKYGFQSPFKAEVYFINTKRFRDMKWGTRTPLIIRDQEFGAVRLRAYGTYEFRVKDGPTFLREIVGTDGYFTTDEISDQLRNIAVSRFASVVGNYRIPVLDLAANYDDLSKLMQQAIGPEYEQYGLELTKFLVENISLPEAVEEALDKRSAMGAVGNLDQYMKYQTAQAIGDAADAPGGAAGSGMGMGMGFAMGQQMANNMAGQSQNSGNQGQATPPPLPESQPFWAAIDGKQAGPFEETALKGKIEGGEISRDTLVWAQGMTGWAKAGDVPALTGLFAAVPPPLPPAS